MMKKRVAILISILALMFILSGCRGGLEGGRPSGDVNVPEFRVGNEGLELEFISGSPPQSLFQGDPLELVVEYSNKGAADIDGGYLYLSGYDKQYITFQNDWTTISAEGKDEFNPLGELSDTFSFRDEAVNIPFGADLYSPEFVLTSCYKYRTIAIAQVCIDPDPYNVQPKVKTCQVRNVGLSTQGAPVAVTSVEEIGSRNRVQFKIYISNVGAGDVIDNRASVADCHVRLETKDINKVDITAWFSDKQLICQPSPVRLTGGSGFALCYYEGDLGEEAYETVLNINLDYGYRDSVVTGTKIYRLPGVN